MKSLIPCTHYQIWIRLYSVADSWNFFFFSRLTANFRQSARNTSVVVFIFIMLKSLVVVFSFLTFNLFFLYKILVIREQEEEVLSICDWAKSNANLIVCTGYCSKMVVNCFIGILCLLVVFGQENSNGRDGMDDSADFVAEKQRWSGEGVRETEIGYSSRKPSTESLNHQRTNLRIRLNSSLNREL